MLLEVVKIHGWLLWRCLESWSSTGFKKNLENISLKGEGELHDIALLNGKGLGEFLRLLQGINWTMPRTVIGCLLGVNGSCRRKAIKNFFSVDNGHCPSILIHINTRLLSHFSFRHALGCLYFQEITTNLLTCSCIVTDVEKQMSHLKMNEEHIWWMLSSCCSWGSSFLRYLFEVLIYGNCQLLLQMLALIC